MSYLTTLAVASTSPVMLMRSAWYDRLALVLMNHYNASEVEKEEKRREAVQVCIDGLLDGDTHLSGSLQINYREAAGWGAGSQLISSSIPTGPFSPPHAIGEQAQSSVGRTPHLARRTAQMRDARTDCAPHSGEYGSTENAARFWVPRG